MDCVRCEVDAGFKKGLQYSFTVGLLCLEFGLGSFCNVNQCNKPKFLSERFHFPVLVSAYVRCKCDVHRCNGVKLGFRRVFFFFLFWNIYFILPVVGRSLRRKGG